MLLNIDSKLSNYIFTSNIYTTRAILFDTANVSATGEEMSQNREVLLSLFLPDLGRFNTHSQSWTLTHDKSECVYVCVSQGL